MSDLENLKNELESERATTRQMLVDMVKAKQEAKEYRDGAEEMMARTRELQQHLKDAGFDEVDGLHPVQLVRDLKKKVEVLKAALWDARQKLGAPRVTRAFDVGATLPEGAEVHGMDNGKLVVSYPKENEDG